MNFEQYGSCDQKNVFIQILQSLYNFISTLVLLDFLLVGLIMIFLFVTECYAIPKISEEAIFVQLAKISLPNLSAMKTSTNLARLNYFFVLVKWLTWKNFVQKNSEIVVLWSKNMLKVGCIGKKKIISTGIQKSLL